MNKARTVIWICGVCLLTSFSSLQANHFQPNIMSNAQKDRLTKYSLIVKKSERKLLLYESGSNLVRIFKVALGFQPIGTKNKSGDGATPEGTYYLTHKNPKSKYYLSLGISYPNLQDAERGLNNRVIDLTTFATITQAITAGQKPPQNTALGGDIFIHGGGTTQDWTWGCIALDNQDMKLLFELLPIKTPITIEP